MNCLRRGWRTWRVPTCLPTRARLSMPRYRSVNAALVYRNWLLGRRIAEEDLSGETRAGYGKSVIENLAVGLTTIYGKGFDFGSIYKFIAFYRLFPILDSLSPKSGGLLSWTHYKKLGRWCACWRCQGQGAYVVDSMQDYRYDGYNRRCQSFEWGRQGCDRNQCREIFITHQLLSVRHNVKKC